MADKFVHVQFSANAAPVAAASQRAAASVEGFSARAMRASASAAAATTAAGSRMMASARQNEQAFRTVGMGLLGVGAVAGVAVGMIAKAGAEFQAEMNQVRAVSGATGQEFESLSGQARQLGATTRFSASEAAEGMGFLAMAGFEANEITKALPGTLQLAAAGNMELAEAADIASNVLTGYQFQAEEISRVNDTMAKTFTSTNTNLSQLGEAMSYAAPVASAAGVQFEEASAAIGLMGNAGIQGSRAGTSLRGAITRLLNPTGKAADVVEELGLRALNANGDLMSMESIVAQLEDSGASTAQMMELFGLRAGPAMAALVSQGSDALGDMTTQLENSGGTAERIAEIQMEGLKGSVIELGSAFEGLKIALFEAGLDSWAEGAVDSITGFMRVMEGLPGPVQTVMVGGMGLVTMVGLLGGGFLILLPRIAATQAAMASMGVTMRTAMLTPGRRVASFLTGPFGAALVGATLALQTFNDTAADGAATVNSLQESMEGVAATSDTLSDEWITNELSSRGLLDAFNKLGLPLDTVRQQLLGNAEASKVVEDALDANISTGGEWSDALNNVSMGLLGSEDKTRALWRALADMEAGVEDFNADLRAQADVLAKNESLMVEAGDGAYHLQAGLTGGMIATDNLIASVSGAEGGIYGMGGALAAAEAEAAAMDDTVNELSASQERLQDAMMNWRDLGAVHGDVMQAMEDAERDRAQEQSDTHNEAIQKEIDALRERTDAEIQAYKDETVVAEDGSRVKRSFYRETTAEAVAQMERERDARIETLEDQKTSWEEHATDVTVNLGKVAAALEKQNEDYANWEENLTTVAGRVGVDVAMKLSDMGEEGVKLTAAMATGTDEEVQRMAAALRGHTERGSDDAVKALEGNMKLAEKAASIGGDKTGKALRDSLGKRVPEVAAIAKKYGVSVGEALGPLLEAIGDDTAAHGIKAYIASGGWQPGKGINTALLRNEGGGVPGARTHRDTVPAALTPGEYVHREGAVDYYGIDFMEAVNRKLIPREAIQGYQSGGRVTGDVAGLNQQFLGQLRRWAAAEGATYNITSGFRSSAEQAALYRAKPNLAAPPGRSNHEYGVASDGPRWGGRGPGRFGLRYPMSYEPWHVEPVNARAMRGGARAAGGEGEWVVNIPKPPTFPHNGIARSATEASRNVYERVQKFAEDNAFAAVDDTGATVASGPVKEMAQEMLARRGWASQWGAFDRLVQKESSWNPDAQNPTSTAYGLGQFLNSTWATVGGSKTSDPGRQLDYMLRYIDQRYGSPSAALDFHRRNNWYDAGGLLRPGTTVATNDTGSPEVIAAEGMIADEVRRGFHEGGMVRAEDESMVPASFYGGKPREPAHAANPWSPADGRGIPHPGVSSRRMTPEQYEEQIARHTRAFEAGLFTVQEHLDNLQRRMIRTVPFSSEWMSLFQERKRLVDDVLDDHRDSVDDAVRAEEEAFDDLTRLLDERDRVEQRLVDAQADRDERAASAHETFADARTQAGERLHATVERLEQQHQDELARIEEGAGEDRARAWEQREQTLSDITERGAEQRRRVVEQRTAELADAFDPQQRIERQWANRISTVTSNVASQLADRETWARGLDELSRMGLSREAMSALGLDTLTADSLAAVQQWSHAPAAEVRALNEQVVATQRWAADRAEDEARRMVGGVGSALADVAAENAAQVEEAHRAYAARLAEIDAEVAESTQAAHRARSESVDEAAQAYRASVDEAETQLSERLAEIDQEFLERRVELIGEMQMIGSEQGRSHGDAIIEGMRSKIPGIAAAARAMREAQRGRMSAEEAASEAEETQTRRNPPGGTSRRAPLGRLYEVPGVGYAVRFADASWYRAVHGEVPIAQRLWGPAVNHPPVSASRLEGRLLDRFGMGGIRRFEEPNPQPKYFDTGGELPPGLSMVYNGLNEAEYVLRRSDRVDAAAAAAPPRETHVTVTQDDSTARAIDGLARRLEGTTLKPGDTLQLSVDGKPIAATVTEHQAAEGDRFRATTRRGRQAGRV